MSPTARTLAALRLMGQIAEVVERWIPGANVRRDFLGCIDILSVGSCGILGVQATTAAHSAERILKSKKLPGLLAWLRAGAKFQVWGWFKRGPRWFVRVDQAFRAPGDRAAVVFEPLGTFLPEKLRVK